MEFEDFFDLFSFEDILDEIIEKESAVFSKSLKKKNALVADVINEEDFIRVVCEMPEGVCKSDIKLSSTSSAIEIMLKDVFFKKIALPESVEKGGKARFKNGILEVLLKKQEGEPIEFE